MTEGKTTGGLRPKKLRWQLPPEIDEEPEYTNAEDGGANTEIWWRLVQQTVMSAKRGGPIPQFKNMPADLARALGAFWGLAQALNAVQKSVPREEWQPLGLHDADDLLGAVVQGREHPALRFWQSLGPKMESRPTELEARTKIIAAARVLSRMPDVETGKKIGITKARRLIAKAVRKVPTFENVKDKTVENWEAVQLPKVFAMDITDHRKARAFSEKCIRACESKSGLENLSALQILEFAKIAASECVSPSLGFARIDETL